MSFILNYRIHGRERRYTIGRHPELSATAARERALHLRRRVLDGSDPLEEREQARSEPTVGDLATQYLDRYAAVHKRPTSIRNDRQMIDGITRPRLGALRLKAVGKRDIETLHASLKATPYRANRVLALLSKMFGLATEWGWRTDNPIRGIHRFHEDRRERWLLSPETRVASGEAVSEAKAFLLSALTPGPRNAIDLFAEAHQLGISKITLKRAKKELTLEST